MTLDDPCGVGSANEAPGGAVGGVDDPQAAKRNATATKMTSRIGTDRFMAVDLTDKETPNYDEFGGPDRIRTGDLQRDRLACLAATPRVRADVEDSRLSHQPPTLRSAGCEQRTLP